MLAGWKVVIDKNCVKVVTSNTASQKLIENQHNQRLDSIASKRRRWNSIRSAWLPSKNCTS